MKFKQLIKGKNSTERTQVKGIVSIRGYYPDVNVIYTDAGFSKMYQLPDFDSRNRTEYEAKVKSILHYGKDLSTQICHIRGKDYMVISVKAESVDDALVRFAELDIEMQELSIAEWCDIITSLTQNQAFSDKNLIGAVNKKGKPAGSLVPHLQPYTSATRLDPNGKAMKTDTSKTMDINDLFVRTMILTSIPDKIYSSLCMELGAVSDSIITSLFFREINKEKCMYSIKNFKKQMSHNVSEHKLAQMESLLEGENRLINAALFVSIQADNLSDIDDLTEKVRGIAKKYLANINLLEYQQVSAFRSILPLGMSYIKINKVISEDDLMGLLPVSWSKFVARDVSYGTDLETDKEIYYNRTMAGGFGFVLGSDVEIIEKRIMKEAEQYAELGKKVEIYVIDPRVTPAIFDAYDFDIPTERLISPDDSQEYKNCIYKTLMLNVLGSGSKRSLGAKAKVLYEKVLAENPADIEEFKRVITENDETTGLKFAYITDSSKEDYSRFDEVGVCCNAPVGTSKRNTFAECTAQLIKMITHTKADMVYVLNADAILATGALRLAVKMNPDVIYTFTAITRQGAEMQSLYNSDVCKAMIEESDFLDMMRHNTVDRIALGSILDFDKRQKAALSSTDEESGILVTGDTMYMYK